MSVKMFHVKVFVRMSSLYVRMSSLYVRMSSLYVRMSSLYPSNWIIVSSSV